MRIKRIEIEGFKSYSTKQVVDDLDPQFNAITGLNGSGKSNILDAICFLLGITNLQQVRAHTLTDLVYKVLFYYKLFLFWRNKSSTKIEFDFFSPYLMSWVLARARWNKSSYSHYNLRQQCSWGPTACWDAKIQGNCRPQTGYFCVKRSNNKFQIFMKIFIFQIYFPC